MKKLYFYIIFGALLIIPINVDAFNLENGEYYITSKLSNKKVVDLSSAKVANSSKIQLYESNNTKAQRWIFEKTDDDYYIIKSALNKNYVLDVKGASFKSSNNVQLYKLNNTNAQKWKIDKDDFGYYTIKSYNEKYVLDISGAKTNNGTDVQIYESNNTNAQKFAINKEVRGEKTIEDGIYNISTFDNTKAITLENGNTNNMANIILTNNTNDKNQRWEIKYLNNGFYSIKTYNSLTGVLDVSDANKVNNTNVQLFSSNNTEAQQWIIKESENGYFNIISRCNGLALDTYNQTIEDNSNIVVNDINISNSQKFKLNKIEDFGLKTIEDGYYFINTKLSTSKMLDIKSAIISENNNIQIYNSNSSIAQKWYVKYIEDGYYGIFCNKDTTYALTSSDTTQKSNIQINIYNNLDTQKWIIKDDGNGYYTIMNKYGNSIDIDRASTNDGTNVQLYENNNTNAQQFKFMLTAEGITSQTIENGYYFITSALNENYVLDITKASKENGANIQLYSKNSTKAQKWYISYISNGYYKITSGLDSTKAIDVALAGLTDGTNVQSYTSNGSYAQQWIIRDAGDETFYIVSNCNGLYLDIDNANISDGANIETNSFTGEASQKFRFSKTRLENLVIDVSQYQKDINWTEVKKQAGIYGVIIRISAGCEVEDTKLAQNISEVKRLGIPYGIYIYSYAENYNEGVSYAKFTKKVIEKYNLNPTLGIYLDIEWNEVVSYMNTQQYTEVVKGFMSVLSDAKIYANLDYANGVLNTPYLRSYITWIAQWNNTCSYTGYYKIWQFSSNGYLPGIEGRVDLNYYYFD